MSVDRNTGDTLLAKTLQATEHKQTQRLYPTLPTINRYDVCLPLGSTGETRWTAAEGQSLKKDTQFEKPVSSHDTMKEQILILEQQNKELLAINNKWAKEYRTMMQFYKKKVQFLKALTQDSLTDEEKSHEEEKHVTFSKMEHAHQDPQPRTDGVRKKLQTTEEELRAQNHALSQRWQHQQEEIRRLNKVLEETLKSSQPQEMSSETLQDIWKHQAEVYKEDFLRERRDREKLKGKNLELEKGYKKIHEELRVFKSQVTLAQPMHRCCCMNRAKHPDWEEQQRRYTYSSKD